jgi:predicted sulfurtransferase
MMGNILLFYKYTDLGDPQAIASWQRTLCLSLDLRGRILIAHEGINGTLGGSKEAIEAYKKAMQEQQFFSDIDFKESPGSACHFPRLKVQVKKEIVCFRATDQAASYKQAAEHITPEQAHALMQEQPDDLIILDGRNNYESKVGAFEQAITPNINTFREFPAFIDEHLEQFKDKQVVMYCTGGIRCERASAYLKSKKVAKKIYQIAGGIHRYIEKFPNGFFKGKNYVFDARVTVKVTEDILSTCDVCNQAYDDYSNCINAECNKQIIVCPMCIDKYHNTCSETCLELVTQGRVNIRTKPTKLPA